MRGIKTAVLVSGGGTNLQALIDAKKAGIIEHAELAVVISSAEGVKAIERAQKAGIPVWVIEAKSFASRKEWEAAICDILASVGAELIVLAGFMSILSADFVKKYEGRILNVHPALIPSFAGKGFYGIKVHEAALARGVKITGATVHFVDEIPDGGPIILQKAVEVKEGDTPQTLQRRVMEEAEWKILPEAVELVATQMLNRRLI